MRRLCAGLIAVALTTSTAAQEIPALKDATPEERTRVTALIEAAKREGAVTYWDVVIQPETNDALAAAFRKHYGLPASFQVNYQLSATANLITRIEQEIGAKRVTIDVAAIASPPWVYERVAAGDILEYDSPQYRFYQKVFDGGLGKKGYFAFNGAYIFVPMWSSDRLDFKGTSWKNVIDAVPPGRLTVGDVSKSVAYLSTHIGLRQVLDQDFFRKLAQMKPPLLVRSEQIAARVVTGEDLMAFSGMPTRVYQNNGRGAKLKFLLPDEGVVLMPACMFILKEAPHPAAAKLWTDFILSEEGQNLLVKGEALISGRSGFKSPLPDYAPGIDSLKVIKVDWQNISTQDLQKIRSEWTGVFNP